MATATPNTVLRLAAAQTKVFFRPSPHFLVAATARELGDWARLCDQNEDELANKLEAGIDALMDLVLEHCGLTMDRIRKLHLMRFSILNPVENLIDQCVGQQWQKHPTYWGDGSCDAYTISAEPSKTIFHLIIYGELFSPDLDAILNQNMQKRRLILVTRLEFIKYCLPDIACHGNGSFNTQRDPQLDPRREVKTTGPYRRKLGGGYKYGKANNILALIWVISSRRWRPHWKEVREKSAPEFQVDFEDYWLNDRQDHCEQDWRQRLWENVMICQGFEGLEMIREGLQDRWIPKIQEWRDKIARLERERDVIQVGRYMFTLDYPWLLGDLRCCVSGYCTPA